MQEKNVYCNLLQMLSPILHICGRDKILCFHFKQKFACGELFLTFRPGRKATISAGKLKQELGQLKNPPDYKLLRQASTDCISKVSSQGGTLCSTVKQNGTKLLMATNRLFQDEQNELSHLSQRFVH